MGQSSSRDNNKQQHGPPEWEASAGTKRPSDMLSNQTKRSRTAEENAQTTAPTLDAFFLQTQLDKSRLEVNDLSLDLKEVKAINASLCSKNAEEKQGEIGAANQDIVSLRAQLKDLKEEVSHLTLDLQNTKEASITSLKHKTATKHEVSSLHEDHQLIDEAEEKAAQAQAEESARLQAEAQKTAAEEQNAKEAEEAESAKKIAAEKEAKDLAEKEAKEAEKEQRLAKEERKAEAQKKAAAERETMKLAEQKAEEVEQRARLQAEAEKKAAETKQLAEQKAKEAEEKARLQGEAEKKAAAEKEAKQLGEQEEALAAEDKRVAEEEAAGGWVSAEKPVSEEEEVDCCDEYVRREVAVEAAERAWKRPMVNSVEQDAECVKRRKASLDLELMRGPLIPAPEEKVPIEAAGRSIIIAGRRNMVVAENFDPSQLGAASLPGLDDLCNRHLALDDVETLVYFWYGAMLFAFVRTDAYQLEGVKELLRKRFHPVAPKEALRCTHCSQTFYNPVQARHHELCWETNGRCRPGMESMSIAGPPAFYLPPYLLDFLGLWEHDILDLLDACRVPVAITGKPNTSTHKYFPKEIYKEKMELMKQKNLKHLLTHKSDHLWGDRTGVVGEARLFGKERFRIVPELPHLSFLLPLNMWPPELSAPFFARCKPSSFGRYYYQTEVEIEDEGAGVKDEGARKGTKLTMCVNID